MCGGVTLGTGAAEAASSGSWSKGGSGTFNTGCGNPTGAASPAASAAFSCVRGTEDGAGAAATGATGTAPLPPGCDATDSCNRLLPPEQAAGQPGKPGLSQGGDATRGVGLATCKGTNKAAGTGEDCLVGDTVLARVTREVTTGDVRAVSAPGTTLTAATGEDLGDPDGNVTE